MVVVLKIVCGYGWEMVVSPELFLFEVELSSV